jgi:hypothetical protein
MKHEAQMRVEEKRAGMNEAPQSPPLPPSSFLLPPSATRRSWRAKFAAAFRGLKLGVRGHSSFFVHFFFAALVLAAAVSCSAS